MTVFDHEVKDIDGKQVSLSQYKGKKLLIVNTASECGFTPQYEQLEYLHRHYGDKVQVLGFPSNDFGGQEPGSDEQVKGFCTKNYGVSFPLFSKISVAGAQAHPLYKWLKETSGEEPHWNFFKYLVDESGKVVKAFPAALSPLDENLLKEL